MAANVIPIARARTHDVRVSDGFGALASPSQPRRNPPFCLDAAKYWHGASGRSACVSRPAESPASRGLRVLRLLRNLLP